MDQIILFHRSWRPLDERDRLIHFRSGSGTGNGVGSRPGSGRGRLRVMDQIQDDDIQLPDHLLGASGSTRSFGPEVFHPQELIDPLQCIRKCLPIRKFRFDDVDVDGAVHRRPDDALDVIFGAVGGVDDARSQLAHPIGIRKNQGRRQLSPSGLDNQMEDLRFRKRLVDDVEPLGRYFRFPFIYQFNQNENLNSSLRQSHPYANCNYRGRRDAGGRLKPL